MKAFTENFRYTDYDLTPDSVVIDCGCYEGKFARLISERHDCRVLAFEPIPQFYEVCKTNLAPYRKVELFNLGVSGSTRDEIWAIKGDSTGMVSTGDIRVPVSIRDIAEVFAEFGLTSCDLLKLNIEAAEYSVILRLIDTGLIGGVKNLQVQWHSVLPSYAAARAHLEECLLVTHERTWERGDFDNGWDNFRLKS
jgi:FkbM family methyltransferase